MAMNQQSDRWAEGDAYEPYIGRWSRLVAREFLDWPALPPSRAWLDVGCGTGALSQAVLERCAPVRVIGIDPSEEFIAHARRAITDDRMELRVGDAEALPLANGEVDHGVSGLALNFIPDQARALAGMRRAVCAGGTVAAYVWAYAGEMQLIRTFWDAAGALDPAARDLDEGVRFPGCNPGLLAELWRGAGLLRVETHAIDVATVFSDFDDYWSLFLGGQGPAPGYCMSLAEDARTALRDRIHSQLPVERDGTIHLIARAWAVKGSVPS